MDPVLARLHDERLIDYIAPEFVPHKRMPDLVAGVDVVVDQIMSGSYGVAAVEAMAAGRVVIGNVAPDVRDLLPIPVPIIDVAPGDLESVLRHLSEDPDYLRNTAAAGLEYAVAVHDGRESAAALSAWLIETGFRRG